MNANRTSWLALGVVALLAFAGCGKKDEGAPGEPAAAKEIVIWWALWAPAVGLQKMGDRFEKETGIKVTVNQIPWEEFQKQTFLNFENNQTDFDIVVGDSQWLGRASTKGLYVDLTDWIKTNVDLDKVDGMVKKYLCQYPPGSDKYYAAPCEPDAAGFAYRKDWFEDAANKAAFKSRYDRDLAVPQTWNEVRDIAEFFQRPGKNPPQYGIVQLTGRGYDALTMGFQQLMWAFGGSWGDPVTFKVDGYVNSRASVRALEFLKELCTLGPPGSEALSYGPTVAGFTNGSTALMMTYFAFYPDIVKIMGDQAGFFMVPRHGNNHVISLGGQGFSISTKTTPEKQAAAKKFIAWFNKKAQQKIWINYPGCFTSNTEVLASEDYLQASPYNEAFAASLPKLQDFWNVPQYNGLLKHTQKYVGAALDGKMSARDALDKVAEEHEKIFREAGLLK